MDLKIEIDRLQKLIEAQEKTIKKLTDRDVATPMDRESLILALAQWRTKSGIPDPQRYLRNRSTDQLRKMHLQVQESGASYRLGRKWKQGKRV